MQCSHLRRNALGLCLRVIALVLATACHGQAVRAQSAPLVLRFSHVVADATPKGLAARRLAELVAQRSGGRIRVDVFPGAQLYGDQDEMQALQVGAVELLAPSLSKFARVGFPEFEFFDLPFLFDDLDQVHRITEGPLGKRLLQGLSRQGLVGLGYLDNGFKHMSANRPLQAVPDFARLRMRVQSAGVIASQMRALGATPVVLPFSATREALEKGIVNGTENPASNLYTQGMHRVQTDLSLTQHGYLGYAVVTNQRFWRSLSNTDQSLIAQAIAEAIAYGNRIANAENDKALAALHRDGIKLHRLSAEQRQALRQAVQPVHDQWRAGMDAQTLRTVEAATRP